MAVAGDSLYYKAFSKIIQDATGQSSPMSTFIENQKGDCFDINVLSADNSRIKLKIKGYLLAGIKETNIGFLWKWGWTFDKLFTAGTSHVGLIKGKSYASKPSILLGKIKEKSVRSFAHSELGFEHLHEIRINTGITLVFAVETWENVDEPHVFGENIDIIKDYIDGSKTGHHKNVDEKVFDFFQ